MGKKLPEAHVTHISVQDIQANPHNPRTLFDDEPMQILAESIKDLGILVPLTIYQAKKTKGTRKPYVLLDGERRWRCAQNIGLKEVPAIVVEEPDEQWNILTMFHIHNVREGWELMPTALKLQTLMTKFNHTNERKLAELTKLNIATVRRCKTLLSYPEKYQNMLLAPPSERWKSDFFIDLERIRAPSKKDKLKPWVKRGDVKTIDILVEKFNSGTIKAGTEFRKLAETYRASQRQNKVKIFEKKFEAFLSNPSATIESVEVPGASFAKEAKEIHRSAGRLLSQIKAIDLEDIASDEETIEILRDLVKIIRDKLDKALLSRPR